MPKKSPKIYKLKVNNWEKWNPNVKTGEWFKFSANFFSDPYVQLLSMREKLTYIVILTHCCLKKSPSVSLLASMVTSSVPHRGVRLDSTLSKLSESGLIEIQREEIEEKRKDINIKKSNDQKLSIAEKPKKQAFKIPDEDLERVYQKFPRKQGKALGFKKLKTIIKNESDLANFEKAVERFAEVMAKENRKAEYIMQFSTFVNSHWTDYLTDEVGSVETQEDKQKAKRDEQFEAVWGDYFAER